MRANNSWLWPVSILVLLFLFLLSILVGTVAIPPREIFQVLSGGEAERLYHAIIVESRIPRAVTGLLAGAGLSLAGLLMQTLFRNPLAGPSVMGLTSGASLAVAILTLGSAAIMMSPYSVVVAAIVGSTSVLIVILIVARKFADIATVLIVGLMLSFFTSAIVGFLQSISSETALKNFVFWGFGSFANVSTERLPIFVIPVVLVVAFSPALIKSLNALLPGELHARAMGIQVPRLRFWIMLATGILTGVITAFCGPVAFIGLAAPHLARLVFRSVDHRLILPGSLILGGALGLACDIISRLPGLPGALPLNTVCAFMGAPVVVYLIFAGRKRKLLL